MYIHTHCTKIHQCMHMCQYCLLIPMIILWYSHCGRKKRFGFPFLKFIANTNFTI